jgi:hypothetical protein
VKARRERRIDGPRSRATEAEVCFSSWRAVREQRPRTAAWRVRKSAVCREVEDASDEV